MISTRINRVYYTYKVYTFLIRINSRVDHFEFFIFIIFFSQFLPIFQKNIEMSNGYLIVGYLFDFQLTSKKEILVCGTAKMELKRFKKKKLNQIH